MEEGQTPHYKHQFVCKYYTSLDESCPLLPFMLLAQTALFVPFIRTLNCTLSAYARRQSAIERTTDHMQPSRKRQRQSSLRLVLTRPAEGRVQRQVARVCCLLIHPRTRVGAAPRVPRTSTRGRLDHRHTRCRRAPP